MATNRAVSICIQSRKVAALNLRKINHAFRVAIVLLSKYIMDFTDEDSLTCFKADTQKISIPYVNAVLLSSAIAELKNPRH
jgi:hypothetical protein